MSVVNTICCLQKVLKFLENRIIIDISGIIEHVKKCTINKYFNRWGAEYYNER